MTASSPLRAAIVGAGPSGFYAAGQLLSIDEPQFAVDLYDRLPTPYGLVRSGVAPDHPKIKSVTKAYDKTSKHERFRFFGHVELGSELTREQLLERYHVVLYTIGTATDKRLGIPGEELRGSHPATEFVAWYNGHPDHRPRGRPAGQARGRRRGGQRRDRRRADARAGAVGARLTDTADHAIDVLSASGIEEITILARRGPLQAAFTNPELLEMGELERGDVEVVGGELDELSAVALPGCRQDPAAQCRDPAGLRRPAQDGQADHRLLPLPRIPGRAARRRERPRPRREDREQRDRRARRRGAGRARHRRRSRRSPRSSCSARSATRGRPVAGIPFDEQRGLIRNEGGRVTDAGRHASARRVRGRLDQARPVRRDRDQQEGRPGHRRQDPRGRCAGRLNQPVADDIDAMIAAHAPQAVTWEGWEAIDAIETAAGAASTPADRASSSPNGERCARRPGMASRRSVVDEADGALGAGALDLCGEVVQLVRNLDRDRRRGSSRSPRRRCSRNWGASV